MNVRAAIMVLVGVAFVLFGILNLAPTLACVGALALGVLLVAFALPDLWK